jgi:anaerobic C4-dicarboxylate transporter
LPVSAATVALIGALAASGLGLPQVMMITIPATLVGAVAGAASIAFRGTLVKLASLRNHG